MSANEARLELSMAAEPLSVRLLRAEVLRWLSEQRLRNERLAAAIGLATSEAVANVVRHAYEGSGGRVDLDARMDGEEVTIEVSDHGHGLVPGPRGEGGMGLPLISQVADSLAVYSNHDGTTLAMRFAVRDGGGGARWSPRRGADAAIPALH